MSAKLCPCPERKCGSLATPRIIKHVTEHIGTATLDELKKYCIQHFKWRKKQEYEFDKGVQPYNVETFIERVNAQKTKAGLSDLLRNSADSFHEKIKKV
jgi:hypothetical protein